MRILVIGGSGFVSGTVVRAALEADHRVWIVTRGKRPVPEGVVVLEADRHDDRAFQEAVDEADTSWDLVVDCIGFNPDDARQDLAVFTGRCGHLVFISTDCVYSPQGRPFGVEETFQRFDSAHYGKNKRRAEVVLLGEAPASMPVTVLRPPHIYGPGSLLGCLPRHGRDARLLTRLRDGEPLRLVAAGVFYQQPVFAPDLARMILGCAGNDRTYGQIYQAAGPDVVESRRYYEIVAEAIGVELKVEECLVSEFLHENPSQKNFCCHRIYRMDKARSHGLAVPSTPLEQGLRRHVSWLESERG